MTIESSLFLFQSFLISFINEIQQLVVMSSELLIQFSQSCSKTLCKVKGSAIWSSRTDKRFVSLVMEPRTVPLLFLTPEAVAILIATTKK